MTADDTRRGKARAAQASALQQRVHELHDDFVDFLTRLVAIESPTDQPETQGPVQTVLRQALEELGYTVRIIPGRGTGGHLYAARSQRSSTMPVQLLMGHTDTVWPVGTLERMPVQLDDGRLQGPGTLDMKGGLTQMVFALRAIRDLGLIPPVEPIVFLNSDEEIGSPDSKRYVRRLARCAIRSWVLEPALGTVGKIKTARKGVGTFDIELHGRASHAGLDPESGASAILELGHVISTLNALNAPERGTTVNVGVVRGGTRSNVIAAHAHAQVDVRVTSMDEGRRIDEAIRAIEPVVQGVRIQVEGGVKIPPLERTARNTRLWRAAERLGGDLGLTLDHALAGGGSDGNTTSQFTATLDGLGCVGDGAHALHEYIEVRPSLDRCALLAALLMTSAEEAGRSGVASGPFAQGEPE